jgi:hypothetical protein
LRASGRLGVAVRGGIEAGLTGAATLVLIRVVIASVFAIVAGSVAAVVRAYLSLFSSPAGDTWLERLARSPLWLALKVGAYPVLGDRTLEPGFDLRVVLLGVAIQLVQSLGAGVLLGLLTVGRSATHALPVGLLLGIGTWFLNGYVVAPLAGGGELAAASVLLVEFIPYGLVMALSFLRYEQKHGLHIHLRDHRSSLPEAPRPTHW